MGIAQSTRNVYYTTRSLNLQFKPSVGCLFSSRDGGDGESFDPADRTRIVATLVIKITTTVTIIVIIIVKAKITVTKKNGYNNLQYKYHGQVYCVITVDCRRTAFTGVSPLFFALLHIIILKSVPRANAFLFSSYLSSVRVRIVQVRASDVN